MQFNKKGFTLIELLIVIVIIGVLVTIVVSVSLNTIEKTHIATLNWDLSTAYKASVLYHIDNPDDAITLDILQDYGYRPSKKMNLNIVDGSTDSLKITATHRGVRGVYQLDQSGHISKQ